MFQPGELIVYGTTGVCRVEGMTYPNQTGPDRNKPYYQLKPLHQDGFIYTPVDNAKVPMRSIITREDAEALIDLIPTMQAESYHAPSLQALAQHYQSALKHHDCKHLLELVMSIYAKQQEAEARKRHLGMLDERYMKQAERLLHGELSVVLGIPLEEVPVYMETRIRTARAACPGSIEPPL